MKCLKELRALGIIACCKNIILLDDCLVFPKEYDDIISATEAQHDSPLDKTILKELDYLRKLLNATVGDDNEDN